MLEVDAAFGYGNVSGCHGAGYLGLYVHCLSSRAAAGYRRQVEVKEHEI